MVFSVVTVRIVRMMQPAKCYVNHVDTYNHADHDYCRFKSVLLVHQITVIGNEVCL